MVTIYWKKRFKYEAITKGVFTPGTVVKNFPYDKVEFQKAYRKNAEKMMFTIKKVTLEQGRETDLNYDGGVFDSELGERVK